VARFADSYPKEVQPQLERVKMSQQALGIQTSRESLASKRWWVQHAVMGEGLL